MDGLRKKVHSCVEEKSFTVEMLNLNFELQCIAEENTVFDWNETIEKWLNKAPDNHNRYMYIKRRCSQFLRLHRLPYVAT